MADVRFAVRALLKRPVFSAVVVLTLALGIGANTIIFGVVDTLLLRPVPFPGSDRLVRVLAVNDELGVQGAGVARGDFVDLRKEVGSLSGLSAYSTRDFDLTDGETPAVVRGAAVSPGLFALLEVDPAEGRDFVRSEERPGEGRVVILSEQLRRDRFGDDPALGKTLELDGERYEVVGVMPEAFHFPTQAARLWVPLTVDPGNLDRMSHFLGAVGRLAPGATPDGVDVEVATVAERLAQRYPTSNRGWTAHSMLLTEYLTRGLRPALLVLSGAVALLLLIACANVANLLLVRATGRQKETGIRSAVGCPRSRLVRLFLLESTLLALLGAGVGLVLAHWGFQALAAFRPANLPALANVDLDWAALLFTLAVALATGIGFGLMPALQLAKPDLSRFTKDVHGSPGPVSRHLRSSLVVAEVAVALVLIVGAALMLKGFVHLSRVDVGFDPENVLALQVRLSPTRYPTEPPQVQLFESLLDETAHLPGVVSVAAGSAVPLLETGQNLLPFEPEAGKIDPGQYVFADFSAVTPHYFRTLRIPLREGRDFRPQDDADAPPVLIVNDELAELYWPGESAVGQRLVGAISGTEPVTYEVVGVVGSVRQRRLVEPPAPAVYAPYRQIPHLQMMVLARSTGDPLQHADAVGKRLAGLDPDQPIARIASMEEVVSDAGGQDRFYTGLLSLFGSVGLLLAAVGVYGVISYTFARRKQELAIRMVLGADPRSIFGLVVREGFRLTSLGLILGLFGTLGLASLLSSLLYGVSPRDPWILTLALVGLLAVGLAASCLSARRAIRVDSLAPLREGETTT